MKSTKFKVFSIYGCLKILVLFISLDLSAQQITTTDSLEKLKIKVIEHANKSFSLLQAKKAKQYINQSFDGLKNGDANNTKKGIDGYRAIEEKHNNTQKRNNSNDWQDCGDYCHAENPSNPVEYGACYWMCVIMGMPDKKSIKTYKPDRKSL